MILNSWNLLDLNRYGYIPFEEIYGRNIREQKSDQAVFNSPQAVFATIE